MAAQDGTLHSRIGGDGAHRLAKHIRSEGPTVVEKVCVQAVVYRGGARQCLGSDPTLK